jgi:NADP-dependent 3-hydroxy acid dehydrogenase YdfG
MNAERKIAVITGASSGIGEATAYQLSKGGFRVIVAARRTDRLKKIAESTGGQAIELDVSSAVPLIYLSTVRVARWG